jgi:enamine deaminase RidA (YjgF/YER057c/UK114 family)
MLGEGRGFASISARKRENAGASGAFRATQRQGGQPWPQNPLHQSRGAGLPPSYTQVVEATGPGRTVYIAGQLGTDRTGEVVGDRRLPRPGEQVFENLKEALAVGGFEDVVKLNSYLGDIKYLQILREVRGLPTPPRCPQVPRFRLVARPPRS